MSELDTATVETCVQHVFGSPEGQIVLEWLDDLYLRYKSLPIIQSGLATVSEMLAYRAGQADLVISLRDVFDNGFAKYESSSIPNEEDE